MSFYVRAAPVSLERAGSEAPYQTAALCGIQVQHYNMPDKRDFTVNS